MPRRLSGFTLIEMLVVIAIISILMTAAGPVFDSFANHYSPRTVASAVAGQLERARLQAIARNEYVWVRLGQVAEEPNDFFIGVYETLDGTDNAANAKGAWSGPRFRDVRLSNQLDPSFNRPSVPATSQPDAAAWIRFSPSGEAALISANPKEKRVKLVPPTGTGTVTPWIELGLQPTRTGKVPASLKKDVGSVQLSALTGQTLVFSR
jgi:type IV fimbrial biogenesis protein FimT